MIRALLDRKIDGIPTWAFALRVVWVAVALVLTLWLGQEGTYFVYQGF